MDGGSVNSDGIELITIILKNSIHNVSGWMQSEQATETLIGMNAFHDFWRS